MPGLAGRLTGPGATLASLVLLVWLLGLVLMGEGLDMDTGRRRHPMWEWVFSHPVRPSAVFAAEILAPVAANAVYWTAPIVPWVLYAQAYGAGYGIVAAVLVGVPAMLAAAAVGKAMEVATLLRAAPRSRGAVIGLMTWLGTSASTILVLAALSIDTAGRTLLPMLEWLPLPSQGLPWLRWFLGGWGGQPSFLVGVGTCLATSAALIGLALASTAWISGRGLAGTVGRYDTRPARSARFGGRNALFRKELTWFIRDRSALIQVVLVPATMAAGQVFNLHGALAQATYGWPLLCAAGILFGTYFLAVVGPKSLASEGGTLWLAMTWPYGVEALLRAKARLWAILASVPALGAMVYAAVLFPDERWKIASVALGWCVFAWSMALKAVTLARVTSDSGEVEKIPIGRRSATYLGTLSFAVGVMTQEAGPAVAGIVFSVVTAAAMWQNFRARLPYLLDPWSERLPPPPILMHAMVAVSILVELGAVLNAVAASVWDHETTRQMSALSYDVAAVAVSVGVVLFLRHSGVPLRAVWYWGTTEGKHVQRGWRAWAPGLLAGISAGLLLGALGAAYVSALGHWPVTVDALHRARGAALTIADAWVFTAVLFAPVVEELLFRGLLFRAMVRDWPVWQAAAVSAAFFASYHPVLAWLPVGLLGAVCALLFRRTGRLVDAVALHAAYNAVVVGWQWLR